MTKEANRLPSSLLSPTFIIGQIRIGSVEGASCVNLGNNFPTHFQNQKKHNQGFGNVGGDHNRVTGTRAMLDDSDFAELFGEAARDIPEPLKRLLADMAETAAQGGS